MSPEDSSTPATPKSKQERIRDNQRRSRARRQEYLTELEQRLRECHDLCREAALQRAAYAELEAENARLRDLLNVAGVGQELVGAYTRQDTPGHSQDAAAVSLRRLRPKLQSTDVPRCPPSTVLPQQQLASGICDPVTAPSASACCSGQSSTSTESFQPCGSSLPPPLTASQAIQPTAASQPTTMSPISSYEWLFDVDTHGSQTATLGVFDCDAFNVPPNGPLLQDEGDTILCSMAKQMIDQYNPTPSEMEEIKSRLATAFSLPTLPETGCRVNTQILFQVLSEVHSKQSVTFRDMNAA